MTSNGETPPAGRTSRSVVTRVITLVLVFVVGFLLIRLLPFWLGLLLLVALVVGARVITLRTSRS